MHHITWSNAEKVVARRVFNAALQQELAELMIELKAKAQELSAAEDIWRLHDFLGRRRREIDQRYDFRYSQLIYIFGVLLLQKRIHAQDLTGLSEEKLELIGRFVTLCS
jgi:hypothetical protein